MSDTVIPFGPYALLAALGRGAAGAAYLARPYPGSAGVPTPFVLKQLHAQHEETSDYVERFLHEAQVAVSVDSPHVARVFDVGEVEGSRYIALEYVPGWTLGKVLVTVGRSGTGAPLEIVHALVAQAARGLGALHGAKTQQGRALDAVHRDVSPKNIMVGEDGIVKVIDLGLTTSKVQAWKTVAGRIMGSPGYMAPEQIRGQAFDRRIDLYALGVITWELLTGKRWITVEEPIAMLRATLERDFTPPSSLRPGLSPAIDRFCARAMAPDLEARLPTAEAFLQALAEAFPPAASPGEVRRFLQGLLPKVFEDRRVQVARLLQLPLPEPPDGEALVPTVVHVRRPGVQPEPEGTRVLATRVVGSPLLQAPSASVAPVATPPAAAPAPMTRLSLSASLQGRSSSLLPLLTIVAVALAVGFGAGAWFTRQAPVAPASSPVSPAARVAPAAARPAPAPRVAPGRPAVTPVVRPKASAPPPRAPRPVTPAAAAKRPRKAARPTASGAPPPVVDTPSASPSAIAARVQRRAVRLKESLPPKDPRRGQVDLLLARLAMLKASGFGGDATAQLARLSGELSALEAR